MINDLFDGCVELTDETHSSDEKNIYGPLPTCKGVIFFANSEDIPIQLLLSANIRRAVKSKLQSQETEVRSKRADIGAITEKVYYCCCYNDFRSLGRYNLLARSLFPETYRSMITLPRQTFVKIDLSQRWPYFSLTENPLSSEDIKIFGPFPTRRAANEMVQTLHDVFMLCQRPDLIAGNGNAASCPYYQMSTCPAPCIDSNASADYIGRVNDAIAAARGEVDDQTAKFGERMKYHAAKMEFEQAEQCKKAIEKLALLKRKTYCWTGEIADLKILHIDRSAKISVEKKRKKQQTYSAFLIRADKIFEFEDFLIDDLERVQTELCDKAMEPVGEFSREQLSENISLLSYFLYRNNRPGIWIDCSEVKGNGIARRDDIYDLICEKYDIETETADESK